jgi:hypothetical protein
LPAKHQALVFVISVATSKTHEGINRNRQERAFSKSTPSDYFQGFYFIKLVGTFVFVDEKNLYFPEI